MYLEQLEGSVSLVVVGGEPPSPTGVLDCSQYVPAYPRGSNHLSCVIEQTQVMNDWDSCVFGVS